MVRAKFPVSTQTSVKFVDFTELYLRYFIQDIEDITCPRLDTNFTFECSTRYLTSERRTFSEDFRRF